MPAGTEDDDTGKVFVGYVFRRPEKINFDLYTHLCHAFLVADEEGNVLPKRSVPSRELTDQARRAGVKVLLSLGGWGWDQQFATMVTKTDAEDRYVESVMGIVDEYDYNGIDLDWEYPDTDAEVIGFERLARRFLLANRRRPFTGRHQPASRSLPQEMGGESAAGTLRLCSIGHRTVPRRLMARTSSSLYPEKSSDPPSILHTCTRLTRL
jgi:hypothetical protein